MNQFLLVFDKIKHLEIQEILDLNEFAMFVFSMGDVLELQKVNNAYELFALRDGRLSFNGTAMVLAAAGDSLASYNLDNLKMYRGQL